MCHPSGFIMISPWYSN